MRPTLSTDRFAGAGRHWLTVLALGSSVWLGSCSSVPTRADAVSGTLPPCPIAPRCKSSQATDQWHGIAPLRHSLTQTEARSRLRAAIEAQPRTKIIRDEPGYLYATFTTKRVGFTDDVEFLFRPDGQTIDLRSAGRIGWYDWGLNRRRVKMLREALARPIER